MSWTGTLQQAVIYFQTESSGTVDTYIDDVVMVKQEQPTPDLINIVTNGTFDTGTGSWSTKGAIGTLSFDEGTCKVTGRTATYGCPDQVITSALNAAGQGIYQVSARVKLAQGDTVYLVLEYHDSEGSHWKSLGSTSAGPSGFSTMTSSVDISWSGTLNWADIYFQAQTDATSDMWVDDVSITIPE